MLRPTPSNPNDVQSWSLIGAVSVMVAGYLHAHGWYVWVSITNAALFFAGAWATNRRHPAARWLILAAVSIPLVFLLARGGPSNWKSWIGAGVLLWIAWLAWNLPRTSSPQKP